MAKRAERNKANLSKKNHKSRAVKNTAPPKCHTKRKQVSKKKKKINIAKILKWTCLLALIIGATIFLFTTPIFNITKIEVVGNNHVSSEEIESLSQIQLNENIFRNLKSKVINNVKENAYIENVTVKRMLPNTIQITVEERNVKFMVKLLNSYAYLNSQGYILEITDAKKEVPILEGGATPEEEIIVGNRLNIEDLKKLETVLRIMSTCEENEINTYITSINMNDETEYIMYLEAKAKTIHLGDASNLSTRILYVKAIIESEEGRAGDVFVNGDLNNGFQPYFREKI